ncbi:MAG: hypothetical protein M1820_001512 [Bogoriella megaspora]|nr:MAG: hypothetical protein M1820_001512 [Bogoriella megaspora]
MPLHLLGKKSWNVYNTDNIARVRRDEAEAQAREEERERRMQEVDGERRLAILRGTTPPPLPADDEEHEGLSHGSKKRSRDDSSRGDYKRRRRLHGEDDTDRDIRLAREDQEMGERAREGLLGGEKAKKSLSDAPLLDEAGHINLFPQEKAPQSHKDWERDKKVKQEAEKKKELEAQTMVRFSDAAGYKQSTNKPWYAANDADNSAKSPEEEMGKDVWGNADPLRNERAKARLSAADPLDLMKKSQVLRKKIRENNRKLAEEDEKRKEIEAMKKEEKLRKRKSRHEEEDDLEGFSLDAPADKERRSRHRHSHRSLLSLVAIIIGIITITITGVVAGAEASQQKA